MERIRITLSPNQWLKLIENDQFSFLKDTIPYNKKEDFTLGDETQKILDNDTGDDIKEYIQVSVVLGKNVAGIGYFKHNSLATPFPTISKCNITSIAKEKFGSLQEFANEVKDFVDSSKEASADDREI